MTKAGRGDGRHVAGSPGVVEGVAGARGLRSILVRRAAVALATLAVAAMALVARADAFVYWTNGNAIGRANLDGTGVNQSFITGASGASGVAVDGAHLYWTNADTGSIGRASLDGSGADQSFITGASNPQGLAVDGAHIYWANTDTNAIGRANLDGTGVDQRFIIDSVAPNAGVVVDGAHIYW